MLLPAEERIPETSTVHPPGRRFRQPSRSPAGGELERLHRIRRILTEAPLRLRNICVTGHIDHGKTTLTDSLLMSNGFLSQRLVGKARYLDFRDDEQNRGITMKSAGVTLYHRYGGREANTKAADEYVVTLLDSPGHVDFAAEVSAAARLSDGSLIVVDVVEGVCSQTRTVLRQALSEGLQPILVLNKIDRLFLELQLDATEAYLHLRRVLEDANAVLGAHIAEQRLRLEEQASLSACAPDQETTCTSTQVTARAVPAVEIHPSMPTDQAEVHEEETLFEPAAGNVVFASALDGWAFRLADMVQFVAQRFGIRQEVLDRTLWGDFYIDAKQKRVQRIRESLTASGRPPRSLFAQFVLEPIAYLYQRLVKSANDEQVDRSERQRLVERLGIAVPERDLFHRDGRYALQSMLSRWLPLSQTVLDAVVDLVPAAVIANRQRLGNLWPHDATQHPLAQVLARAISEGDISDEAPVMIYVSKVMGVEGAALAALGVAARPARRPPAGSDTQEEEEEDECWEPQQRFERDQQVQLALGRILCGAVEVSSRFGELFVYGPRYNAEDAETHTEPFCVRLPDARLEAFLLHGRDVASLRDPMETETSVRQRLIPGAVVALYGVGEVILKSATISTLPPGRCLPCANLLRHGQTSPVVFFAVEPAAQLSDLPRLRRGLRLLNQADPAVETFISGSGEMVLGVSGELHLQRCLCDLEERFAGVPVKCSAPMTAVRETVAGGVSTSPANPWVVLLTRSAGVGGLSGAAVHGAGQSSTATENTDSVLESLAERFEQTSVHERAALGSMADASSTFSGAAALEKWASWSGYREEQHRVLLGGGIVPVPLPSHNITLYIYAAPLPRTFVQAWESSSRGALRSLFLQPKRGVASQRPATAPRLQAELLVRLHRAVMEDAGSADQRPAPSALVEQGAECSPHECSITDGTAQRRLATLFRMLVEQAAALGPHDCGSNVLVVPATAAAATAATAGYHTHHERPQDLESDAPEANTGAEHTAGAATRSEMCHWDRIRDVFRQVWGQPLPSTTAAAEGSLPSTVYRALVSAFQVVCAAGPLVEEPLQGVCFVVHVAEECQETSDSATRAGSLSASSTRDATSLISLLTEALRQALLAANPRLVEPLFQTEVQCSSNALGRVHTVLRAARAQVLSEQIKEYQVTSTFFIRALVPASAIFGLAEKIRRASSGVASDVELRFVGDWKVIEEDPFWYPATAEDIELLGVEDTTASMNNLARNLMEQVRARKGRLVAYKLVERAEKQRTLARKK